MANDDEKASSWPMMMKKQLQKTKPPKVAEGALVPEERDPRAVRGEFIVLKRNQEGNGYNIEHCTVPGGIEVRVPPWIHEPRIDIYGNPAWFNQTMSIHTDLGADKDWLSMVIERPDPQEDEPVLSVVFLAADLSDRLDGMLPEKVSLLFFLVPGSVEFKLAT